MHIFDNLITGASPAEKAAAAAALIFSAMLCLSVSIAEISLAAAVLFAAAGLATGSFDKKEIKTAASSIPLLFPWAVYLSAALVSSLMGFDCGRSLSGISSDAVRMCVYCLLFMIFSIRPRWKLMDFYIAGALTAALWGISQVAAIYACLGKIIRATGTVNTVTFGEIMSLALYAATCSFAFEQNQKKGIIKMATAFILSVALILSQTRGAYLATAAAFVVFAVFCPRVSRKKIIIIALMIATAFGFFCYKNEFLLFKIKSMIWGTVQLSDSVLNKQRAENQQLDIASGARIAQWKVGLKIFMDYPVFGIGPANIRKTFDFYHPWEIDSRHGWGNVHNLYLQQAAERGIIGLAALLLLFLSILRLSWRWFMTEKNQHTLEKVTGQP